MTKIVLCLTKKKPIDFSPFDHKLCTAQQIGERKILKVLLNPTGSRNRQNVDSLLLFIFVDIVSKILKNKNNSHKL